MTFVKAKKYLGQHFLKDENISESIANAVMYDGAPQALLEVGAGTGALTKYLFANKNFQTFVVEVDKESIDFLIQNYPLEKEKIIEQDFLSCDFEKLFNPFFPSGLKEFTVIGNFPYNISTQILFKVLEHKNQIPLVVGMFQKEVAKRIAAPHGKKDYGILSVLMQTFYKVEYLFDVPASSFNPPPKVESGVLKCTLIENKKLSCDEKQLYRVVKTAFNQRRKTLRNALKSILHENFPADNPMLNKRAEQLSPADFEILAGLIEKR